MQPGTAFVPTGSKVEQHKHGGEGSGNFGHAGRPGEVGGSGPGGGAGTFNDYSSNLTDTESVAHIKSIVDEEEYEYYGIRILTENPNTREVDDLKIGDEPPNSYTWSDGESTGEELNGTSALQIQKGNNGVERAVKKARGEDVFSGIYLGKKVVLLGSDSVEYGEDEDEIIMRHAKVLATFKKPYGRSE